MQRRRAWLKCGFLVAVPCAFGLALWPVAQQYRHRAYVHEWLAEGMRARLDLTHVRYLLDRGVPVDTPNNLGTTLLHHAAFVGDVEGVQFLLSRGANINLPRLDGATPLMDALSNSPNNPTAFLLLAKGADVNMRNDKGESALFLTQNMIIARTLLEHGADANARDNREQTALFRTTQSIPTLPRLSDAVIDLPCCDNEKAKFLLSHDAAPNLQDNKGNTALMLLAYECHDEDPRSIIFARILLQHGARLDLRNKQGLTALQIARKSGAKSLARLLERATAAN